MVGRGDSQSKSGSPYPPLYAAQIVTSAFNMGETTPHAAIRAGNLNIYGLARAAMVPNPFLVFVAEDLEVYMSSATNGPISAYWIGRVCRARAKELRRLNALPLSQHALEKLSFTWVTDYAHHGGVKGKHQIPKQ